MNTNLRPSLQFLIFHRINPTIITHLINSSKSSIDLKRTHVLLIKSHFKAHLFHRFLIQLFTRLIQFPADNLGYAHHLFDEIPNCKNQFFWTSLIRYYVFHYQFAESISLYARMHREGVVASGFTFSSVLCACARARIPAIFEGKQVHARVVQLGFLSNRFVLTSLLDMYAKCGFVVDAWNVFITIDDKDIVAWTAMICGYTKMGMMDDAQKLFDEMGPRNLFSWVTMVAGYAKCGNMKAAKELYDTMPERNSVSCLAMIAGYGRCGDVVEAEQVFNKILAPDASCYAGMVACYSQNGYAREAIDAYMKMNEAKLEISEVSFVGVLSACTQLGDVEMASRLVDRLEDGCCDRTLFVSNALIHMHSKFGSLDKAWEEFNRMSDKDVVTYSALITALADHGKAKEALDLFSKMQEEGIKPNQASFTGVLNACGHAGMVEQGCKYFELMNKVFGIEPLKEHYACIVDLLGRAGEVETAYILIKDNLTVVDAKTWGSLLGACKIHGNVELGEIAARHLFQMEPENTGNYVLLANTYASRKEWDDAERVRIMMVERGIKKSPGFSWISRSI